METVVSKYWFWLAALSAGCLAAERISPWRKEQKLARPEFVQDLFWLAFNGYFFAFVFGPVLRVINSGMDGLFVAAFHARANAVRFVAGQPLWAQFAAALVLADFIEWCVHNLLHRSNWLWRIHRVHHSIVIMDWIGNFRFHWGEIIIYNTFKYLPLALLGTRWQALLAAAVVSTAIGHLNHSNLNISWGPLRYVLNSPRMHIWHHEKEHRGKAGVNFAIVFSLWDWLFGTAYMPREALLPEAIGFKGQENVPAGLANRFFVPWVDSKNGVVE